MFLVQFRLFFVTKSVKLTRLSGLSVSLSSVTMSKVVISSTVHQILMFRVLDDNICAMIIEKSFKSYLFVKFQPRVFEPIPDIWPIWPTLGLYKWATSCTWPNIGLHVVLYLCNLYCNVSSYITEAMDAKMLLCVLHDVRFPMYVQFICSEMMCILLRLLLLVSGWSWLGYG